jgi:hypothetical protein
MIIHDGDGYKKEYLYGKYIYIGKEKWLYSWYEQNGVRRMERKLISSGYTKPQPRKKTSNKTKQATRKTPVKSVPRNVPKKPNPPKKIAKPSFSKAKPASVGKFVFNKQAPRKREVVVPQPPPPPGPKPTFSSKKQESVTKFEYLYGIKHLEIKHMQYENKSVYVSKPINVAGNVMSVALNAVEEHPLFDELSGKAADRQTSVEYYIAPTGTNPSPTLDDWFPILPEDVRTVKSELLMFGTARTAELRFPALIGSKEKPFVYRNGLKMEDDEWSFADGGYKVQLLVDKDATAIYTIDYTPNSEFYNPWSIDVNQRGAKPVKQVDTFELGTNHNKTVVLKKYPYINYETVNTTDGYEPNLGSYVPVKVTLKDAGIIGPNKTTYKQVLPYDGSANQLAFTKNMTNYKTGNHPELNKYSILSDSAYNGFEYYQEGDKLFFTETFNKADIYTNAEDSHGNATIQVEYEYLSSDFRMKIILRRNSTDENTLTPIVHEYALKFKVMK